MPVTRQPGRARRRPQPPSAGVIAVVLIVGFVIAVVVNMRRGRPEVGSELELAANRKPYLADEELEGQKLDRTLGLGLVLLGVIAVALPLYWLAEPGRQAGAVEDFKEEPSSPAARSSTTTKAKCAELPRPRRRRRRRRPTRCSTPTATSSPRSTGRRRRSTRCCTATRATR